MNIIMRGYQYIFTTVKGVSHWIVKNKMQGERQKMEEGTVEKVCDRLVPQLRQSGKSACSLSMKMHHGEL